MALGTYNGRDDYATLYDAGVREITGRVLKDKQERLRRRRHAELYDLGHDRDQEAAAIFEGRR